MLMIHCINEDTAKPVQMRRRYTALPALQH